jgi:hypothetical protein
VLALLDGSMCTLQVVLLACYVMQQSFQRVLLLLHNELEGQDEHEKYDDEKEEQKQAPTPPESKDQLAKLHYIVPRAPSIRLRRLPVTSAAAATPLCISPSR